MLERHRTGAAVADLCSDYGISSATFFRLRSSFEGLPQDAIRRMLELETTAAQRHREARRREQDVLALRRLLARYLRSVEDKKSAVSYLTNHEGISERRACELVALNRSIGSSRRSTSETLSRLYVSK